MIAIIALAALIAWLAIGCAVVYLAAYLREDPTAAVLLLWPVALAMLALGSLHAKFKSLGNDRAWRRRMRDRGES